MSHFEFVAVAFSLIYAAAIANAVVALPTAYEPHRRYWVHVLWLVQISLHGVLQWWGLWRMVGFEWDGASFLLVFLIPALLLIRVSVLIGENPSSIDSYREHFFRRRVRFFSVEVASDVVIFVSPWFLGSAPWFSIAPIHSIIVPFVALPVVGLCTSKPRIHLALVIFALAISIAGLLLIEVPGPEGWQG